jgi:hypothetical protein
LNLWPLGPDNILFAYDAPDESQSHLVEAFARIKEQFEQEGMVMSEMGNPNKIVQFAKV